MTVVGTELTLDEIFDLVCQPNEFDVAIGVSYLRVGSNDELVAVWILQVMHFIQTWNVNDTRPVVDCFEDDFAVHF
ncbi:hypothetical protein D3C86_2159690 [compost metagenome]